MILRNNRFFCVLPLLSLLSVPLAFADSKQLIDGVYLGGQLGYLDSVYNYDDNNPPTGVTSEDPHASGVRYGLYIGDGNNFADDNAYIGIRAGVLLGSSNQATVTSGASVNSKASQGNIYTLDILPGLTVSDGSGLMYLVLGGARTNVSLKTASEDYSDTVYGWRVGFGYAFTVAERLSMHVELVHNIFGDVNFNSSTNTYTLSPANNALTLGIEYSFGEEPAEFLD